MGKKAWSPAADLVIKNVKIYTVDITIPEIQAGKNDFTIIDNGFVAAKDGKTIMVGATAEFDAALVGPDTEVIDGKGRTLLPGLIDCHMHAMFAGIDLLKVNQGDAKSLQEFLDVLKPKVAETPAGKWVKGCAWNHLVWDEPIEPTRFDLDKVSTEHPICCYRFDYHRYVVNSKALEVAGIDRNTPDPIGGTIGHFADGEPDGQLYENSAMGLIDAAMPALTEDDFINAIVAIGHVLNSRGLTSVIDANMTMTYMRAYLQALKQGKLTFRENMMFYTDKAWGDVPYHLKRIEQMPCVTGFGNDMLKMNGVKVTYDGNVSGGTAKMRKDYISPGNRGYSTITEEELTEIAKLSASFNWQLGVHDCGDLAADETIRAIIEGKKINDNDLRPYIIHLCEYHPDQIPLLAKYNIPVASQPSINWLCGEQSLVDEDLGHRYMPAGTLIRAGIITGGSTDCPIVDCNPFWGFYGAVTRKGIDGTVWNPDDRITTKDALIMWTKSSAYFSHDEDKMGSVEVGNFADYVIIDRDVVEVPEDEIADTKVLKTILGGKVVYEA
jgi:predicted amidohydrolase YtcJ